MTRIDGLVRGMPRRVPTLDPNVIMVGSSRKTGGSHTHPIPDNIMDGDICVVATASRNSNIGAVANSGTGAAWTQDLYTDLGTDEEVRIHHKFAKNESGNWTVSQSGTGASIALVLRVTNPAHKPTVFGGWDWSTSVTSPAIYVPSSGVAIRIYTGAAFGGVGPIGQVTVDGVTWYEQFIQQGSDECVSIWWAGITFQRGVDGIYRAMNDTNYDSSSVMYARKAT